MSALRILHVDDEPDIREVVEMSLGLDPGLTVHSCGSGMDALKAAAEWSPNLILMDVMMPVMDGPTTLIHLRESPQTAAIPVVFMTARAQTRELNHFRSLGAAGVIPKPFDPMTLAVSVRNCLKAVEAGIARMRRKFTARAETDAAALAACRAKMTQEPSPTFAQVKAIEQVKAIAHALSGAAGIYGFATISSEAAALEDITLRALDGTGAAGDVAAALDRLTACIDGELRALGEDKNHAPLASAG